MSIDEIAELIYSTLCRHRRAHGASSDMSLAELATALGLSQHQVREAVMVARLSEDLLLAFVTPARDRVRLGRSWLRRCESEPDTSETT